MSTKQTKAAKLVGEICLYGTTATGAGWLARGEGTALLGNGETTPGRGFTEAMWLAEEALQAAGLVGVVAVYAPGGERFALVLLGAVGSFGDLAWSPAGAAVTISAEQILAAAGR